MSEKANHPLGNYWHCRACGSYVVGVDFGKIACGKQYHTTPSGKGECRVVNFDRVHELPKGRAAVEAKSDDDTAEHTPV